MTTIQRFKNKFAAIPENKWSEYNTELDSDGACCALGHCGEWIGAGGRSMETPESKELRALFAPIATHAGCMSDISVSMVNDGGVEFLFPQKTPKERILAALDWLEANAPV